MFLPISQKPCEEREKPCWWGTLCCAKRTDWLKLDVFLFILFFLTVIQVPLLESHFFCYACLTRFLFSSTIVSIQYQKWYIHLAFSQLQTTFFFVRRTLMLVKIFSPLLYFNQHHTIVAYKILVISSLHMSHCHFNPYTWTEAILTSTPNPNNLHNGNLLFMIDVYDFFETTSTAKVVNVSLEQKMLRF